MGGTVFYFLLAHIPSTSVQFHKPINIHVDYPYVVSVNGIIACLSMLSSIPSASSFLVQYCYCVLRPLSIAVTSEFMF